MFLIGAAALTAAAAGLASVSEVALLWVAAPAAGFAFGCHWSLMPSLASEVGASSLSHVGDAPRRCGSPQELELHMPHQGEAAVTAAVLGTQLFGMRSFATLYCLLQFSTTFGTYALATRLVSCAAML